MSDINDCISSGIPLQYISSLSLDLHHHSRRGVNLVIAILELLHTLTGKCGLAAEDELAAELRLNGGRGELAILPADADLEAATGAET